MHYDAVIIGAGMSGLAAGIRLACYEKSVCILEKHYAFGGLNSYYTLNHRPYDVGLHALTNYVPPSDRHAPLNRVLRQLRMPREALDLHEQGYSEVRFPEHRLRFTNDAARLIDEVAEAFPDQIDGFRRLSADLAASPYEVEDRGNSARAFLRGYLSNDTLIDMILCPLMFYGNAREHDMDVAPFVVMFRSIFHEGFARPRGGVRVIIKALVRQFRKFGGKLRMSCGVERIEIDGDRAAALILSNGETITADRIFSCAGQVETMNLCGARPDPQAQTQTGRVSFMESVSVIDRRSADLGVGATITFFCTTPTFTYARPEGLIDPRSGVLCCPDNYQGHEDMAEGVVRLTTLADHDRWSALQQAEYDRAKVACFDEAVDAVTMFVPDFRPHTVARDVFTPVTIRRFTGHLGGAVYGSPHKSPDGRTPYENLFLCGTDQGFSGIIGAMLSGVIAANTHGLSVD
jgi:phytoene dehydrogenase-like protein